MAEGVLLPPTLPQATVALCASAFCMDTVWRVSPQRRRFELTFQQGSGKLRLQSKSLRLSLLTQDLCEQVARTVPSQDGCNSLVGSSLVPDSADLVEKRPGLCRLDITVPWEDFLPSYSGLDVAGHPLAPSDAAGGTASATTVSQAGVNTPKVAAARVQGGVLDPFPRALDGLVSGSLVEQKTQ